jgi:hypothetical protein
MQILYECASKRSDLKQPKTMQIVGELEVAWSRIQQQPDDVVKIWLVHKAAHPRLKDSIAYTADSKPWASYLPFRASLVNHACPFDQMIARESGRTPADANGEGNARHRRFQPKGGVNKPGNSFGKGKFKPKPPGPPTCYGCGEKGHIRRDCPKEQKVGTAAAVACSASRDAELPACAAVGSGVQQGLLLLSSDACRQALVHMATSAAAPAAFPQTAMFTPAASLP